MSLPYFPAPGWEARGYCAGFAPENTSGYFWAQSAWLNICLGVSAWIPPRDHFSHLLQQIWGHPEHLWGLTQPPQSPLKPPFPITGRSQGAQLLERRPQDLKPKREPRRGPPAAHSEALPPLSSWQGC